MQVRYYTVALISYKPTQEFILTAVTVSVSIVNPHGPLFLFSARLSAEFCALCVFSLFPFSLLFSLARNASFMYSSTVEYSAGTVPALLLFTLDTNLARVYRHFAPYGTACLLPPSCPLFSLSLAGLISLICPPLLLTHLNVLFSFVPSFVHFFPSFGISSYYQVIVSKTVGKRREK